MKMINYIKNIFLGIWHLLQGMYIAMLNFIRPKVTEQYPENRGKVSPHERFRGQLIMPHNEQNQHKCTACKICEMNCPNGTIRVVTKMETDPETGKEKKVLDRYMYDIGSCIFCALCTESCPSDAIDWTTNFEHGLFTKSKLVQRLNREGSSLMKKIRE
jgi:NADH-quinone oxidoreductase subunit I